ncbi:hypothetical protein JXO52_13475 [bacterium]|nr:hypothetical protein [bacterium]
MSEEDRIKERVEKTMRLMETEERLKADPWFFTRLQARISARNAELLSPVRQGGRWRPVVLAALAGVNITIAALWTFGNAETRHKETAMAYLARDYGLTGEAGDWLYNTIGE